MHRSSRADIAYGGNTKQEEAARETYVHVANQVSGSAVAPPAACSMPAP